MKRRSFIGSIALAIATTLAAVYVPSVLVDVPIFNNGWQRLRQQVDGYWCEAEYRIDGLEQCTINWWRVVCGPDHVTKMDMPAVQFEYRKGLSFVSADSAITNDGFQLRRNPSGPVETWFTEEITI